MLCRLRLKNINSGKTTIFRCRRNIENRSQQIEHDGITGDRFWNLFPDRASRHARHARANRIPMPENRTRSEVANHRGYQPYTAFTPSSGNEEISRCSGRAFGFLVSRKNHRRFSAELRSDIIHQHAITGFFRTVMIFMAGIDAIYGSVFPYP